MGANLWPADAVSGAPVYNGRALRSAGVGPLAGMGSTLVPLGARSGIRPGTPASVVSVTSTAWSAGPFAGLIAAEASAVSGVYGYSFDTAQTGAVAAAGSAARVDRLDVQVSDPAEGDGTTTPSIQVVYTQGAATGGATPTGPSRSHRLCLISVPASGSGSPSVLWAPDWATAAGAPWLYNTLAELPTVNVPAGQYATVIGDPTTGNNTQYNWSGTAWVTNGPFAFATGTFGVAALAAGVNATATVNFPAGRFTQVPNVVATVVGSTRLNIAVISVTTTQAQIQVSNGTSAGAAAGSATWIAVQAEPGNANS